MGQSGAGGTRFPAIEGIRALAALGIVAYHVGELGRTQSQLATFGERLTIGVPVFFVVSAFVLYRPFVARRVHGDPIPAIGPFLLRRVARIVPLYWVTLTVVWLTSPLFSGSTRGDFFAGEPWWRYYLFAQVYDETSSVAALGPAWSLNVEMAFYLVLPFWGAGAAWLVRRGLPVHVELLVLGVVIVGGISTVQRLEGEGSHLAKTPLPNAGYFAIGMALAVLSVDLAASDRPMVLARAVRRVAPLAAPAIALVLALFVVASDSHHLRPARAALVLLVLLPAAFDDRAVTVAKRILMQRHLQVIGALSYGVYLFHRQIALGLRLWSWSTMDRYEFVVAVGFVTTLTVVLAQVSFRHLESPVIRWARTVGRPAAALPAA